MFRRFLFAGLAMLTFTIGAMADVQRSEEHQFEADFPAKAERLTKPIDEGGKIVMVHAKDKSHNFMLGAAVETAEELQPEMLNDFAKAFVEGLMNTRKSASINKEEELKLSDSTPKGLSFVIQHESGWVFTWATIENGKGYFVIIEGETEDSLKDEAVKSFKKSVKIQSVK